MLDSSRQESDRLKEHFNDILAPKGVSGQLLRIRLIRKLCSKSYLVLRDFLSPSLRESTYHLSDRIFCFDRTPSFAITRHSL